MKTKKFAFILALVLIVGSFAGCSSNSTDNDAGSGANTQNSSDVVETSDAEKSSKGKMAFVGIDAV